MTTCTALVAEVAAIVISGVTTRSTTGPPLALNTAALPMQWTTFPRVSETSTSAGTAGGQRTLKLDILIALEPVAQNLTSVNYTAAVALEDSLIAALRAHTWTTDALPDWDVRVDVVMVAGSMFWVVMAELTVVDDG